MGEVVQYTRKTVDERLPSDQTYQPSDDESLQYLTDDIIVASMGACSRPLSELCELSREEKADLWHSVVKLRMGPF